MKLFVILTVSVCQLGKCQASVLLFCFCSILKKKASDLLSIYVPHYFTKPLVMLAQTLIPFLPLLLLFSILFNCRLEADEHEVASFIYSLAFFLALMDNRCQKDSCSALGGFSVSCVIRNIPVSVDLLKVIQTKYGFDYGALRTGICGCAVI